MVGGTNASVVFASALLGGGCCLPPLSARRGFRNARLTCRNRHRTRFVGETRADRAGTASNSTVSMLARNCQNRKRKNILATRLHAVSARFGTDCDRGAARRAAPTTVVLGPAETRVDHRPCESKQTPKVAKISGDS